MIKYLMAIDPGKASGFVILDLEETQISGSPPVIVYSGEPDQFDACHRASTWLADPERGPVTHVVMEDFLITPETGKKKETRYSLEVIGAVRYAAALHQVKFVLQTPSAAKSFVDNDRLRNMDLWVPGGEGHAKDAMRHAILYLANSLRLAPTGLLV